MTTVDVRPRPGYRALRILLPVHAVPLACIPLFYHGTDAWLPLVLAACVGASWLYVRRHPALGFGPRALTRLTAQDDGAWRVEDSAGSHDAELRGSSVVLAHLVLLNFCFEDGHRRSRLLLGDEVGAEPLRRLRAYLLNRRPGVTSQP